MTAKHRQQQQTGRPLLDWQKRLWITLAAPPARVLIRSLTASWRFRLVSVEPWTCDTQSPMIICCWHRDLAPAVAYLLARRDHDLRPGFLISPSRDGEFLARVLGGLGGQMIRGSANRTGARALRELYLAMRAGISPLIHPDGPQGPSQHAKSGAALLAQMTGYPLLPTRIQAHHRWQFNTWDRLQVPKPFADIYVDFDEPIYVAPSDAIDVTTQRLSERLGESR